VAVQQHPVLAVPLDSARQYLALGIASQRGEIFHRLAVVHPRHVLFDDRPFVKFGRHVVRSGTNQFHAPLMRLVIRLGSLEAGQEGVMDIDGRAG